MQASSPEDRVEEQPGITLVLGGGGARGLAHFGVFEVLENAGVPVRRVVGNSAGSLVGAAVLQRESAAEALEFALEFLQSARFRRHGLQFKLNSDGEAVAPSMAQKMLSGWRRSVAMHLLFRRESLFHSRRLSGAVHSLVQEGDFSDLRHPLSVVALDLNDGEEVVLDCGEVRQAVVASCSVAGFFPPVMIDGRRLIDAGQADNLPVQIALQLGGAPIVAVDLSSEVDSGGLCQSGIEIMLRSEELGSRWNTRLRLKDADVHIAPALKGRFWLDFSHLDEVLEEGRAAARRSLPQIWAALEGAGAGPQ